MCGPQVNRMGAVLLNFDAPESLNGRRDWSCTPGVRKHDPRPLACAKSLIPLFNLSSVCEIEALLCNRALLSFFFFPPTKSLSGVDVLRTRIVFNSGPVCAPGCG